MVRLLTTQNLPDDVASALGRLTKDKISLALAKTVEDLEDYIAKEAAKHNRAGFIVRSIGIRRLGPLSWEIYHDPRVAPHALFVHDGTKAHPILPKGATLENQKRISSEEYKKAHSYKGEGRLVHLERGSKMVLRWPSGVGGGTGFVFARQVNHPGYKGDPWMERAKAASHDIFARHIREALA